MEQSQMNDRSNMPDSGEQTRLERLYEQLRNKLLDLTKKNKMLNYTFGARSKRQLQIVNEVLEEAYSKLVGDDVSLRIAYLGEPEGVPPDEKTQEFVDAFEHAKVSEVEYLIALEALVAVGGDNEIAIERLERELRERVRSQLGLPPRPKRADVNRAEHARSLGIDPNVELKPTRSMEFHVDSALQTLKYPDELEAIMGKISDEARLAEQEAGISTLFLAFGFLQWYESDTSEKALYAPLLMLPVKVEHQKVRGRDVYYVAAREGAAEDNVSLQKFLEKNFGRELPELAFADADDLGSIESYLAQVRSSIEGLKRWEVRRWLVLGHFAFNRIAIYEDTKPEKWPAHPASGALVGSLLSGFERGSEGHGSIHVPEDYVIDDPEVEKSAPILIQDADASQHSALVDVMKSKNLVIQGPPGTGKSQTIANIIANALAAGKTVLFLAEKLAALEVVKRRLDRAGLGDFCLELHSHKSSPRAVVESISRRLQLGIGSRLPSVRDQDDATWSFARSQIAEYLNALHATADDGATPFSLIWKAIRGRSANSDILGILKDTTLPASLLTDAGKLFDVRGRLEMFAANAQLFADTYGHPSLSPWAVTPPGSVPAYDRDPMQDAIRGLRKSASDLLGVIHRREALGLSNVRDFDRIVTASVNLPDLARPSLVAEIAAVDDLEGLHRTVSFQSALLDSEEALAKLPYHGNIEPSVLSRATHLLESLPKRELRESKPAELYSWATATIERSRAFIDAVAPMRSAMKVLAIGEADPVFLVEAAAAAVVIAGKIEERHRPWIDAAHIDEAVFAPAFSQWTALRHEEAELRRVLSEVETKAWPPADVLDTAARALRKTGFARLASQIRGEAKRARALVELLRLSPAPEGAADVLQRMARYLRALEDFNAIGAAGSGVGSAWAGMETPFDDIDAGIKLRAFIRSKLSALPGGDRVANLLLVLRPEQLATLAGHQQAAGAYRSHSERFQDLLDATPTARALATLHEEIQTLERFLRLDADRALARSDLSLARLAEIDAARARVARDQSALDASSFSGIVRSLAPSKSKAADVIEAITWVLLVRGAHLPSPISTGLLSHAAPEMLATLRHIADEYSAIHDNQRQAMEALGPFGLKGLGTFDLRRMLANRNTVRASLLVTQPPFGHRNGPVKTWTQMSLLNNELPKQKRFTPVRALVGRAGDAICALKPCFMMSPLSLAKFLPPGALKFDVLVIDEASQMRPEDALGAMLRSNQVVVVGDPKQLPPTSFFDRAEETSIADDEELDDIDDESILERCQKIFGEVRRLKWHYRSRCESLIRFSNDSFYDGSLITFPAAKPGAFSIDLLRVNGAYQARRNVAEAERVAEEAVEFMRHFAGSDETSIPTLGIVALNIDQRDLIQETLRRLSADDELVDIYQEKVEKRGEPLFVKNLENVQGDERDFIFISMTYGCEPGATAMKQRFGPINSRQGHRRLNVLFSRARVRIGLFTSFGSADVSPTEASKDGVRILKRYLEYAEAGGRAPVQQIGGIADSDFEVEVAERLGRRGYRSDMQVGVSGFRIDLGIRHPDSPEIFLAGIECDGARYHSSKSARDRDRLREEVLRGLGWHIIRVWSTDWFDNPDRETERLVKRLDELRTRPQSLNQGYSLKPIYVQPPTAAVDENQALEVVEEDLQLRAADISAPESSEDGVWLRAIG
jgi:very-short-patch-repair endonuclease